MFVDVVLDFRDFGQFGFLDVQKIILPKKG